MAKVTKLSSNGNKTVICMRCAGEIPPYAGRAANTHATRFVHHPGQCADARQREQETRAKAQANGFAWTCRQMELGVWNGAPELCDAAGTDRGAYDAHMREHGARAPKPAERIRLRKTAPAARLAPVEIPAFKMLRWTEQRCTARYAADGAYEGQDVASAERRGQFWSEGPYPHSVWVLPYEPAPWEPTCRPAAPVVLHVIAPGRYTTDWSAAKCERGEASRRAKRERAA